MKNRILDFLKAENKSSAQFAEEIGVQASSISHIISGRNNPSLDFVMKMLQKYPALSTDWLLFGKGEMYKDPQFNSLFNSAIDSSAPSEKTSYELKDRSNERQKQVIESKTESIAEGENNFPEKRAKRVIVLYRDGTFKEFLPGIE